jgi:putative membrane protein
MELQLVSMLFCIIIVGSAMGSFTGLVPGIHVNTLAAIMLGSYPLIESALESLAPPEWIPVLVASWVVSASVVHSFVDFVPSVFLGAPSPDDILNILPGHRMLLQGQGMDAVSAAAVGSLVGAVAATALALPLFLLMQEGAEGTMAAVTPYVLLSTLLLLVLTEDGGHDRLWALLLMALSGLLGYLCMHASLPEWHLMDGGSMMLPLLTGLFGMPAMLLSVQGGPLPPQGTPSQVHGHPMPALKGLLAAAMVGWFPGITATAGTVVACVTSPEREPARFISMVASVGTASTVFTLVTLAVSGNGRSGTMIAVGEVMGGSLPGPGLLTLCILLFAVLLSSLLGYLATLTSGLAMARSMGGADLHRISSAVMAFMVLLVAAMTGPSGLLVLLTGTVMGLIPTAVGVNRVHLASCMLLPVFLIYTGLDPMTV